MSTYVYGFTHATHPLKLDGVDGVGAAAAASSSRAAISPQW